MISEHFLSKLAAYIESQITKCQYVINNKNIDIPIHSKDIEGLIVKINILLDENVEGNITRFKLYDRDNQIVKEEKSNIIKKKEKGLFKTFSISINEVI
ncbi:hypothetical protein [Maledivibacter halophilus]|uniref:Uncharacterized protein n=1 Tax=Maledivibacter halophilus TaxID=36842 RepID=A0A1T5K6P7_9FIRM|nr:hypothetical protein [Maledivibacter halophilus]SKC59303.1 hypothetical protein SAMN02194393_01672 [Maledivibacter halophilus]